MITTLYAIQDVLVGYQFPFTGANEEAVLRDYKNWLKEQPHAKDLRLYKIGTFDDETGTIIGIIPECIQGGGQ